MTLTVLTVFAAAALGGAVVVEVTALVIVAAVALGLLGVANGPADSRGSDPVARKLKSFSASELGPSGGLEHDRRRRDGGIPLQGRGTTRWRRRVPAAFLTVVAGRPGTGKSLLAARLAADMSVAGQTPRSS